MFDKFYVGQDVLGFENTGKHDPISRVTLFVDENNYFTVGDDSGKAIEANCPSATQEMANAVLAAARGFSYQSYTADGANIDPAAELGDGATVGGIYSVFSQSYDDGGGFPDISAPGVRAVDEEFPMPSANQQYTNRKIAQTRSLITKTAEEIRLEVFKEIDGIETAFSELELTVDGIAGRVGDAEGNIAELELTAQGFALDISDLQGNYTEVAATIAGLTVTDPTGTTLINGSLVETENLHVKAANIDGTLTAEQIVLTGSISWGDLNQSVQNTINSAGGISAAEATTLITDKLVQSPTLRGASIFGGLFSDLGGQNYITMYTEDDQYGSNSFLNHYSSIYSTSLPLMSMGYRNLGYDTDQWLMQVRNRTVMLMGPDDVLHLWGVWDFSGATVTGLSVVFG